MTENDPLDELAPTIGRVAIIWNDMHLSVYIIFYRMLGTSPSHTEAVFYSVKTDRAQRDMTAALARVALSQWPTLQSSALKTIEKINKFAGRRNDVIHAMWDTSNPDAPLSVWNPHSRLTNKDIQSELSLLISELEVLRSEVTNICTQVWEALRPAPPPVNAMLALSSTPSQQQSPPEASSPASNPQTSP